MSDYLPQVLLDAHTNRGQHIHIERVRLAHNDRWALTLSIDTDSAEFDEEQDAGLISQLAPALLASGHRVAS